MTYGTRKRRACAGDGAGLLSLHDSYFQRQGDGSYGNELEAFQAISCADTDERRTVEEEDALAPQFTEAAPRLAHVAFLVGELAETQVGLVTHRFVGAQALELLAGLVEAVEAQQRIHVGEAL